MTTPYADILGQPKFYAIAEIISGVMEDVTSLVFNYPTRAYPAIRIFSVDYLPNLNNYYRTDGMYNRGIAWDDLINAIGTMPLQAPSSFFV